MLSMEEKNKFIKQIEKVNIPLNLAEIWDYEKEEEMYKNQLISDGYDEGIEQNQISTIKTMLTLKYPYDEISKITGKSIDQIKEISSNLQ